MSDRRPHDIAIPAHWVPVHPLASGGLADIRLAAHAEERERLAAIKIPHTHHRGIPRFEARLAHEAALLAAIRHPNVLELIENGASDPKTPYIALAYHPNGSLDRIVNALSSAPSGVNFNSATHCLPVAAVRKPAEMRQKMAGLRTATTIPPKPSTRQARFSPKNHSHPPRSSLPQPLVLALLADMLRALAAIEDARDGAGALDIVHRDICPANWLIAEDGRLVLCDFGSASSRLTGETLLEGEQPGHAAYAAPETLVGEAHDTRSDLYSVGVIGWELLAGRRLFRTHGERMPSPRIAHAAIQTPESGPAAALVMRLLQNRPAARFDRAKAALASIDLRANSAATRRRWLDFVKKFKGSNA